MGSVGHVLAGLGRIKDLPFIAIDTPGGLPSFHYTLIYEGTSRHEDPSRFSQTCVLVFARAPKQSPVRAGFSLVAELLLELLFAAVGPIAIVAPNDIGI